MPYPTTRQANLPACSPQPPLNAEREAKKLWIPFFQVFWYDSTRGMNPRSTEPLRLLRRIPRFLVIAPLAVGNNSKNFAGGLQIKKIENYFSKQKLIPYAVIFQLQSKN